MNDYTGKDFKTVKKELLENKEDLLVLNDLFKAMSSQATGIPLYEEVVRAWKDLGFEVIVKADNDRRIVWVAKNIPGRWTPGKISFNVGEKDVVLNPFMDVLSKEEIHVISMTLKYLEEVD